MDAGFASRTTGSEAPSLLKDPWIEARLSVPTIPKDYLVVTESKEFKAKKKKKVQQKHIMSQNTAD